jgi:integrase
MAWTEQISTRTWRVRYRTSDGHITSISGFPNKLAAEACVARLNHDGHANRPTVGPPKVTLGEWVATWFTALDLDPRTIDNYRSILRCHILLRWGAIPLPAITTLGINRWIIDLRALGYANTTVASIVKLLSMILTDAADEGLIPANPVHRRRRRGRRSHNIPHEKVWATPTEVLRIADQATAPGGDAAGLLIVTAAWTGYRWGELAGLHRDNIDLDHGTLTIDPRTGTLHESGHSRWLAHPKPRPPPGSSPCRHS